MSAWREAPYHTDVERAALAAIHTFPEAPLTMALTRNATAKDGEVVADIGQESRSPTTGPHLT